MKVLFKNVQWDTDGASLKSCGLKKRFEANVPMDIDFDTTIEEIEDIFSDWLSDEYGYCHNGFDYKIIKPTVITDDDVIKKFFDNSVNQMLDDKFGCVFYIPFAKIDYKNISIMLVWEDGYDADENDKYIDENGYGINFVLVEDKTSYMVEDWRRLNDSCTMSDDYDSIIEYLKQQLEFVNLDYSK